MSCLPLLLWLLAVTVPLLCPLHVSADQQSTAFFSHLLRTQPRRWSGSDARSSSSSTPASHRYAAMSPPASPLASNASYVDVYAYGAVGDGLTDNTAAFQAAISAINAGGGGTVVIPRGYFLFKGSLTVPQGVTLEGTYAAVPSHPMTGAKSMPVITGSLLLPTAGRGTQTGPAFITLARDATLRGVVIYYPEQTMTEQPVPFPWTVDLVSDNSAVLDVECLNCWDFVRAVGSGRHYIARLQGQPLNTGIFIDETYDIGRVDSVHFNPWYSAHPAFMQWQLTHGRAFVIARSDWEYVLNTFAFGYAIGRSRRTHRGPPHAPSPHPAHTLRSLPRCVWGLQGTTSSSRLRDRATATSSASALT